MRDERHQPGTPLHRKCAGPPQAGGITAEQTRLAGRGCSSAGNAALRSPNILEALPIEQRLLVWDLVKAERDGEILIEVSDAVRESLIATMNREELRAAAEQLDTDEIADLAPDLPQNVLRDVFKSLSIEEREQLRAAMSYSEDPVGALMDFSMIQVREDGERGVGLNP